MSIAGAEPPSAVTIDYEAPVSCPRAEGFAIELSARTPRTRIVAAGAHVRALVVRLTAHGHAFGGRLIVREPTGAETERAITADTCAEVVSALALIAAVAIDPLAAAGASAPSASGATTAPAATATNVDAPPALLPDAAAVVAPTPADAELDEGPPDAGGSAPPKAAQSGWVLAVGAHAGVVRGVSPDTRVLVPLFVEVANETGAVLAPALRLRLERTLSSTPTASAARGDFTWTAASVDFCPIVLASGHFGARPCLRVEAGALEARGVDVIPSRHGTSPWLALGPVARGRVDVVGPLFAELELGTTLAIVRDRFFVEPASTVFRAPLFGWVATAGGGVAFW